MGAKRTEKSGEELLAEWDKHCQEALLWAIEKAQDFPRSEEKKLSAMAWVRIGANDLRAWVVVNNLNARSRALALSWADGAALDRGLLAEVERAGGAFTRMGAMGMGAVALIGGFSAQGTPEFLCSSA